MGWAGGEASVDWAETRERTGDGPGREKRLRPEYFLLLPEKKTEKENKRERNREENRREDEVKNLPK